MAGKTASSIVVFSCLILALSSPLAFPQEAGPQGPEKGIKEQVAINSSYATIFVDKDIDLGNLAGRINVSFARYDPLEKELFLDKNVPDAEEIANKIDIIVRKARKILDMRPPNFHVDIMVYENDEDLWDAYEDIFNEKKTHKAFYIHKFRTIYISLPNVSESVLAHEIGHSIIDSYFAVLPPEKIRELLAAYVDVHLKD